MRDNIIIHLFWLMLIISCCYFYPAHAQTTYTKYKIVFTDKNNSPYSISDPQAYLSQRAINRRIRQGISIDSSDLPVNPAYLDSLTAAGNVHILYTSKWLNLAVIQTTDTAALRKINSFPFVKKEDSVALRLANNTVTQKIDKFTAEDSLIQLSADSRTADLSYGYAYNQINLHNGEFLHNLGYEGNGMLIGMLDAGFVNVNTNPAFANAFNNNQIMGTRNFVYGGTNVYGYDDHGAYCLSTILSDLPGEMIGTAPAADFWLMITEDVTSEQPIEMDNWVAGAELADSAGCDIITSSLGYSQFDNPVFNYTYADMNGITTDVAIGADMAVKKGMIVVNAAGNEGTSSWKYIISPADGINVLAVGAVDTTGQVAPFSSYGPSSDGRVKPDVAATGWNTVVMDTNGQPAVGSGTSFACPIIAGLTSCLWQAFPEMTNYQVIRAIDESSSHYQAPDDRTGYGIPDFEKAYDILQQEKDSLLIANEQTALQQNTAIVFPNPFQSEITILFKAPTNGNMQIRLINTSGQVLYTDHLSIQKDNYYSEVINELSSLAAGTYFLQLICNGYHHAFKIIKS
jgi:serine protease AprX